MDEFQIMLTENSRMQESTIYMKTKKDITEDKSQKVAVQRWLNRKGHQRNFWGNGDALYLVSGGGNRSIYNDQNSSPKLAID